MLCGKPLCHARYVLNTVRPIGKYNQLVYQKPDGKVTEIGKYNLPK
jgi:hypothetical protein